MTYKTRQEVLRAAADWIDVCEAAGVEARCRVCTATVKIKQIIFDGPWEDYEFPLALLEGKEVWVGSELYFDTGTKITVAGLSSTGVLLTIAGLFSINRCSWNPPKPKTVMVEMPLDTAKWYAENKYCEAYQPYFVSEACKKALENLK